MKPGFIAIPIIISFLLGLPGCSSQVLQSGDTIIPPVAATGSGNAGNAPNPGDNAGSGTNTGNGNARNTTSLNNFSNMSPLAQPSSDMVYTMLNKEGTPLSIFADNKYLYLLRSSANNVPAIANSGSIMNRYGSRVEVYDVENGSLIRKIDDKRIGSCSAFTVKDSNIYTFDAATGRISLFSSSGSFLSVYETGLTDTYVQKLAIAGNRSVVLKVQTAREGIADLAVFNPDSGKVHTFTAQQLYMSPQSENFSISDFSLYDEKSILVGITGGWLGLFDLEKAQPLKTCMFPMSAGYMEFDGNVLYYASDLPLSLAPANTANFSNAATARQTGRLLINNEFPWPSSEQELSQWQLGNLKMPSADQNGRHYGMAKNTKYLFFLDFIPAPQSTGKAPDRDQDFMVYRIMK